jgi:hypothetical protein
MASSVTSTMTVMRRPRTKWQILALSGALFAAACGDDDGGSEISQEDFIEQANEICEAGNAELEELLADVDVSTMSEEEIGELVVDEQVPIVRDQIDSIRDLGFPDGDEEEVGGILDDAEQLLDDIEDDPQMLFADEDPFAAVNERLAEYGLATCAE